MKFGQIIKKSYPDLVISNRYEQWMKENSNPHYSPEALAFGVEQLRLQAHPRDRTGTFSASSVSTCMRKQQFTWLGMPQPEPTAHLGAIFQNGTFMHVRWQMAGLTEGFLTQAEVPVPEDNEMWLSGTMDGIAYDGSVVEFKSINTRGFTEVCAFGPKTAHLGQGATYLLATGREKVIFIYEDKNTQDYKEFVRTRDELPLKEVEERTADLWVSVEEKELYEPKSDCIDKVGYEYSQCPYKDRCLDIHNWEEAQ